MNCNPVKILSLASVLTFVLSGMVLLFARNTLEYPIMHLINAWSRRCPLFDYQLAFLSRFNVSSGMVFVSLIWYAWFRSTESDYRAKLLLGTVGATFSAVLTRLLQLTLPSHLRPLHTPELGFVPPIGLDPDSLNHWNSFPSDHAALLFGLATVIFLAKPRLGCFAFAWALVLNITRIYLGQHFPSDIAAGAAIGVLAVCLLQSRTPRAFGCRLLSFERSAAPVFYAIAFFLSLQIGTLFEEARNLAEGEVHAAKMLLHR